MSEPRTKDASMKATPTPRRESLLKRTIRFSLKRRVVVFVLLAAVVMGGLIVTPFAPGLTGIPKDPVPVDAIPDIGENQQIVFTKWAGRSPRDVEDSVTYPLTVSLLAVPGVKTVRSFSMFGFSSIYVIFKDDMDFYESRTRILEKLSSIPRGTLPAGVQPTLGPDATPLGQVFWYTLEGRDERGQVTGGWDLHELRTIQDWYVRYALMSVPGVAEVASIGGFVKEYQVDIDPNALRAHGVSLSDVVRAVRESNLDVGAKTLEINRVEYVVRGVGNIKSRAHIEDAVIKTKGGVPVLVGDVAHISTGPAERRGALDKGGAEAVGGVVVTRYGANPMEVIQAVKDKIAEISPGLPRKTLADGRESQVRVVSFYDRTGLIRETLNTLSTALVLQVLVTVLVVLLLVMHLKSSALISGLLPVAVLSTFIAMKLWGVDANIVALSGIAIAIGTMVDMAIVLTQNIHKHMGALPSSPGLDRKTLELEAVVDATAEVAGAVFTAVATTVVSFLPVFAMQGSEGKLFAPLAYTKTFALAASLILSIAALPSFAYTLHRLQIKNRLARGLFHGAIIASAGVLGFTFNPYLGGALALWGGYGVARVLLSKRRTVWLDRAANSSVAILVLVVLSLWWMPLGLGHGFFPNLGLTFTLFGSLLGAFIVFKALYGPLLRWFLKHKPVFLTLTSALVVTGGLTWLGYDTLLGWLPKSFHGTRLGQGLRRRFPGLGEEFMPPLDEGAFLYMPTTMPHASIGEVMDIMRKQDMAINALPEVRSAVGKLGRAASPLDPAPVSMIETIINYWPEYHRPEDQAPQGLEWRMKTSRYRYDPQKVGFTRGFFGEKLSAPDGKPYRVRGLYVRDEKGHLIPDPEGKPYRNWRRPLDPAINPGRKPWKGVQTPDDIWREIVRVAQVPGATSAPRLQPISARLVMLQSGMRADMGIKIKGPDLPTLEKTALEIERLLKEVPSIDPDSVVADRVVGKPYLEIHIKRRAAARFGIPVKRIQRVIEYAIGGKRVTTALEGRERYAVRVRYQRERRSDPSSIKQILVTSGNGSPIPLGQVTDIRFRRGPQVIKSEDGFGVAYVTFGKKNPQKAEVDVVEEARRHLDSKIASGDLSLPKGVSFTFAGAYENQVRSEKRLALLLPLALALIFVILYLQFRSTLTTAIVFSGVLTAWAGGFVMLWLYAQPWFLDFTLFGTNLRDLFNVGPMNLSVAVWVGFLALFGIATDNGVVMASFLKQAVDHHSPSSTREVHQLTVAVGEDRIRPLLMTTATTLLALIPVLTSSGRGADIMIPMAVPSFGGMAFQFITLLLVPILFSWVQELKLRLLPSKPTKSESKKRKQEKRNTQEKTDTQEKTKQQGEER